MIQLDVSVADPQGVHALVAQELAAQAKRFASSLFLRHEGRMASLDNPTAVLALGIRHGTSLSVWADGLDEIEALAAVGALLTGTRRIDLHQEPPRPGESI